jgi:flagellar hook-length control protein FliK
VKPGADAFDSIVQSIATLRESTGKEMEIQLKPEFLGRVVIRLTMDGEGLVARIAAANPRVQQALQGQAGELQATLAGQGLKDVRVVVTAPPTPETSLQQQADRRGQGQREQHRRGRGAAAGVSDPLETRALLAYEAAYSAGTINYLA